MKPTMNKEQSRLVESNMPLVDYIARDFMKRMNSLSFEDLRSCGYEALTKCAYDFDADMGVPFGAWARRRISGSMQDLLRSEDLLSRGSRGRAQSVLGAKTSLEQELKRNPTAKEIAEKITAPVSDVHLALQDINASITLSHSEWDTDVLERMITNSGASPEDHLITTERCDYVYAAVASLPDKMRSVVEQVYFEDRPVREIAAASGVSHSAISQVRSEAMSYMRDALSQFASGHFSNEGISGGSTSRRVNYVSSFGKSVTGGATSPQMSKHGDRYRDC